MTNELLIFSAKIIGIGATFFVASALIYTEFYHQTS